MVFHLACYSIIFHHPECICVVGLATNSSEAFGRRLIVEEDAKSGVHTLPPRPHTPSLHHSECLWWSYALHEPFPSRRTMLLFLPSLISSLHSCLSPIPKLLAPMLASHFDVHAPPRAVGRAMFPSCGVLGKVGGLRVWGSAGRGEDYRQCFDT